MWVGEGMHMSMRKEAPEEQHAFYHSHAWLRCRSEYLSSVGGLCERCEAKGIIRPARFVHHKTYISPENMRDASILLSFDNLEALCFDCHNSEHFETKKRFKVDEYGRVESR